MRASILAAVPLLVSLSIHPADGQVSARLHLDIPIGRQPRLAYGAPRGALVVRDYDADRYGDWADYYDDWIPETVYFYDGYYYDYPIDAYAQPIVIYRYRNEFFRAPRQRGFIQWREGRDRRDFGRAYRQAPRDFRNDRGYQVPRGFDGGQYRQPPQFGRNIRPVPQNGRNGRDFQPAPQGGRNGGSFRPAPQGGRNGGGLRPAPQGGRNGGGFRPAPQGGRNGGQARGGDRSRSRPH